jgi:4-oxalocrotonate tautomerase
MPHVSVKLVTGKSEEQKTRLVEAIVRDVKDALGSKDENISVAIEEIAPEDWTDKVYLPDIKGRWEKLYKQPGYDPLKK